MTELADFNTRSGADSVISEGLVDDDHVELEKSNVLLMGPTGSGMMFTTTTLLFLLSFKVRIHCAHVVCSFHISI